MERPSVVTKETLRKFQMAPVNPKRDRNLRAVDLNEGEGPRVRDNGDGET